MNIRTIARALALAAFAAPFAAAAQQNCGPTDQVAEFLATQHGESVVGAGIADDNMSLVMTWANPESGSWTITVTVPSGATCLVASGTDWEIRAPEPNL